MKRKFTVFTVSLRILVLILLLAGVSVFTLIPISADDGYLHLVKEPGKIRIEGSRMPASVGIDSVGMASVGINSQRAYPPDASNIIFAQPPLDVDDNYLKAWGSDTAWDCVCMDDFWGLAHNITGLYWYGITLIIDGQSLQPGDPSGMKFSIVFYEDNGGFPGSSVAEFTGISPSIEEYFTFLDTPIYRFEVSCPGVPFNLRNGWVSINKTYGSDGSIFFWNTSTTGNENALQNMNNIEENLAFTLTTSPHVQAMGGTLEQTGGAWIPVPITGLAVVLAAAGCLVVKKNRVK